MTRQEVKTRIEEVGIFPGIRVHAAKEALFAAQALYASGITVIEITMTVTGAISVIRELAHNIPDRAVGAGTVLDSLTAGQCIDAGARFITSPGLVAEVVEATLRADVVAIPGALTPTEAIACSRMGADYVKIFPAAAIGGELYIRSLKLPLPHIRLIAAGGVNQQNATEFIRAGASALGVGTELLPKEAVAKQQIHRIHELARRFLSFVAEGRSAKA
jgi:2-dehydro-3-deoxyphosphogluconate aldolase / (4S)-4-hydroxy-2-oxoglutarate aldolase